MNIYSIFLNCLVGIFCMSCAKVLFNIIMPGAFWNFICGLAFGYWIIHGYSKVFRGLPIVSSVRQAMKAFVLAFFWPVTTGTK